MWLFGDAHQNMMTPWRGRFVRVIDLSVGNSPFTGKFSPLKASNANLAIFILARIIC